MNRTSVRLELISSVKALRGVPCLFALSTTLPYPTVLPVVSHPELAWRLDLFSPCMPVGAALIESEASRVCGGLCSMSVG